MSAARPDIGTIRGAVVAVASVLLVSGVAWVCAPVSWQSLIADEQRTDATVLTVISIWTNNVLICSLPLLGGVYAHRLAARGRTDWARVVLAIAVVGVARSIVVIGLVGGLDPRWLASAAAWWTLEVIALGTCCAAGWQAYRDSDADRAARRLARALAFAYALLGVAAVIEVALT